METTKLIPLTTVRGSQTVSSQIISSASQIISSGDSYSELDYWFLGLQIVCDCAIIYIGQQVWIRAYASAKATLFSGGLVRFWFLTIVNFALLLRLVCYIATQFISTYFIISWAYYLPSLVSLSAYSLLVVFFGDIRDFNTSRNLNYVAPSLIAFNILIYVLFAVVASLAHLKHAHREFRAAGSIFIGAFHLLLCVTWLYQAGALAVRLNMDPFSIAHLEDPLLMDLTQHDCLLQQDCLTQKLDESFDSGQETGNHCCLHVYGLVDDPDNGGNTDGHYKGIFCPRNTCRTLIQEAKAVRWRLWMLTIMCPILFGLSAVVELQRGLSWMKANNREDAKVGFFTETCWTNVILFVCEMVPTALCITMFANDQQDLRDINRPRGAENAPDDKAAGSHMIRV